ncbi:hypothetical protein [Thomasclavelia saccharogumia]|uniref:hypothetical protein n=1 Tax=Thomasclavelia saccharogumia TaxID=341225 RepID=UPI00047B099E|nr:hypothetical protein [Thomasclavelia saccharogumia]
MRKLFKLLICLGCILTITGCNSDDKEDKDNQNNETEEVENNQDDKITSKYFEGYEKEYELNVMYYKIKLPINYKSTNNSQRSDSIKMITKDGKELGALITTTEIYEELNPNFTINNIREEFKSDRNSKLRLIYPSEAETVYNDQPVETTVGNRKALLDKGIATDSGGEVCKYAVYHLFLDDENKIPCEFFVGSNEIEPDELAKIAEEMIGTIEEND